MPSPSSDALQVLLVEDELDDAHLILHELRKAGFEVAATRVETERGFLEHAGDVDLVLCDHRLPQFDALRALELLSEHEYDVPLIIVSGAISEEKAVEMMREGAEDFLLKDRLARLGPAVRRVLDNEKLREEQRAAVNALRQSEERYRLLVEGAREYAIFMLDVDGRIASWNAGAERIFGYREEEAIGRPAALIFSEEDRAAGVPEKELATAARTGRASDERWHVRQDGSRFWASGVMEALYSSEGTLHGFVKMLRDNTERKEAEEALRRLNETLEARVEQRTAKVRELAARLTRVEQEERQRIAQFLHDDLQQQLYALDMTLGMLRGRPPGEEAERLHEQAGEILDQALNLTRTLSTELCPPVLESNSLREMLEWLAVRKRKQYNLRVDVDVEDPVRVPSKDVRVLLYQTLREVLFNVVKHAGVDRARVIAWNEAGELVVQVEDEGVGFDEAVLEKRRKQGGGMGLPTVQERLTLVGGRFEIDAVEGEGTCVTLAIPLREAPVEAERLHSPSRS